MTPRNAAAYTVRGATRMDKGDIKGAILITNGPSPSIRANSKHIIIAATLELSTGT